MPKICNRVYERETDKLFLRLLRSEPSIVQLFYGQAGVVIPSIRAVTGQVRHLADTGSIDIRIDFEDGTVLLVENKIDAGYSLTRLGESQPPRYVRSVSALRAAGAIAHSVLLAPESYLKGTRQRDKFDRVISYEAVRALVALHDSELLTRAIETSQAPYEPTPNALSEAFFKGMKQVVADRFPTLHLKRDPNENGVRPSDSRTIYFDVPKTLLNHPRVVRPKMSLQCWDSYAPSASVKIMLPDRANLATTLQLPVSLLDIGGYLRPAGRSLGIVINTPRLETQQPAIHQIDNVFEALEAATRLQFWWSEQDEVLRRWSAVPL